MFYLLNKKKGITSFKAIKEFARKNNIKKVGHTGTLDPMATGLLLIATDDDTRLISYIDQGTKSYVVEFELGYKSDTLDAEGKVEKVNMSWNDYDVKETIKTFVKTYDQMPPDFSAKKVKGQRAYKLAREGKKVVLSTSEVTIENIKEIARISDTKWKFEVSVSRGTYVRSLIRDIAHELGTEAVMTALERSVLCGFPIEKAGNNIDWRKLISIPTILDLDLKKLFEGKELNVLVKDGEYGVEHKNDIIGIVIIENNKILSRRLFGNKLERSRNESI